METGTGKTYVYLRTIFELNKRYGFTKFVIVVPSVAIKEGVYKTLQITEEHFKGALCGQPFDYFLYDSAKLGQVRNFATSPHIQIMVVTVGAINKKDVNNLYKDSEKTGGEKPIDLIRATRPILIVDEPQSVDGGLEGAGKKALGAMNPLCTLRYSATHVDKHHMVFRLDAVDAYERKLVKQIEVAAAAVEGAHNKPYVRLVVGSQQAGRHHGQGRAGRADRYGRPAARSHRAGRRQSGADHQPRDLRRLPRRRNPRRQGQGVHGAARSRRRAISQARRGLRRRGCAGGAARDDPPHHQGASRQGKAPAPAGHQGALPVLHRRRGEISAIRRRRQPGERATTPAFSRKNTDGWPSIRTTRRCSRKWT